MIECGGILKYKVSKFYVWYVLIVNILIKGGVILEYLIYLSYVRNILIVYGFVKRRIGKYVIYIYNVGYILVI